MVYCAEGGRGGEERMAEGDGSSEEEEEEVADGDEPRLCSDGKSEDKDGDKAC